MKEIDAFPADLTPVNNSLDATDASCCPVKIVPDPRRETVQTSAGRISVSIWGEADLPTVVLVHGMRDHARSWDWTVAKLIDGYCVVAMDLRGHGDSSHSGSYTLSDYVSDLAGVVDALRLQHFAIVGHSLGGAIGLRYAAAFPERVWAYCGIECIENEGIRRHSLSPKTYPQRLRNWIERQRAGGLSIPPRYASLADAGRRMGEQHPKFEAETIAHLTHYAMTPTPDGAYSWKYDNRVRKRPPEDVSGQEVDQNLAALACPSLLFYGGASWIPLPGHARLALIRDCQLIRYPDAGHWLHHEERAGFTRELRFFLNSKSRLFIGA